MHDTKKYDIFLFDADGTLFDFDLAQANALEIMFQNYSLEYNENRLSIYRTINIQEWEKFEKGEITNDDLKTSRFIRFFREIGVDFDPAKFNEEYLFELGKGSFLIEGALEICKHIISHNKKIFIVTNGMLATQKSRIQHSLIKDYISDFFVSEVIGFQKPHISYFEFVFSHIPPIPKEKILIIGDSLTADILGGLNAGIDSCWFNNSGNKNHTDITPVYEINKFSELEKFV